MGIFSDGWKNLDTWYIYANIIWLVVWTILKNISQWEGLPHILWKIKNVWNHQPVILMFDATTIPNEPHINHVSKLIFSAAETTTIFFSWFHQKPWPVAPWAPPYETTSFAMVWTGTPAECRLIPLFQWVFLGNSPASSVICQILWWISSTTPKSKSLNRKKLG